MSDIARPSTGIGEVLASLKEEFPDISVSKIRFLEAEGLLTPQRTASKYRKFSAADVDRLRFILRLQRDSFLPLKVIKERLAAADAGIVSPEQIATTAAAPIVVRPPVQEPIAIAVEPPPVEPDDLRVEPIEVVLTESDIANEAGLEIAQVRDLVKFGVLCPHGSNGSTAYDATDLEVAKIARDFLKLGLEARHLKTLRRLAETEADLYAQMVTPAIRTRRPQAREEATETLSELASLSRQMRRAFFTQSLRATLKG